MHHARRRSRRPVSAPSRASVHRPRGRRVVWCVMLALAALMALATPVHAQLLPPGARASHDTAANDSARAAAASAAVSPASPRAAVASFLELTGDGRYADAAAYLTLPDSLRARGARLAEELRAVLDRHVSLDLEDISGLAVGDTADGLPANIEEVATIPGPGATRSPVRLVRATDRGGPAWRFSSGTVQRIPAWYDALSDRWIFEHLPATLLRPGPFDVLRWQWLALPVLVAVAWMLGSLASRIARSMLARLVRRTRAQWDDVLLERVSGPLTLAAALLIAAILIPALGLYAPAQALVGRVLRAGGAVVVFWALWRSVDVAHALVVQSRWARRTSSAAALLPILSRAAKVAVVALALVAVLSMLGYPVAGLLTGLGLGGLAVALAAQKTVENLFGAISIGLDQPFREGDFVKIEDFVGTVETIGLRSTRIRTLDRTIITMPNGKLADMRLESFAVRDRLRLAATLGLVYETTAAQMREVLAGWERVLRAHPKIWPDAVVVRFGAFGASSLDIDVMAWFQTSDWGEFQLIRQEVLLQFMDVVEQAGTAFAFPTRTVHLVTPPAVPSSPVSPDASSPPHVSSAPT
jgi:MscS family membrane protein